MHVQPERSLHRQPTVARTPESGAHPGAADTVLSAPLARWMTHSERSPSPVEERKPDIAEAALKQYAHIHALIFPECSHCDGAMQCCAVAVGRHGHEARTVTTSAPAVAPVPRAAGVVAVAGSTGRSRGTRCWRIPWRAGSFWSTRCSPQLTSRCANTVHTGICMQQRRVAADHRHEAR